MFICLVLLFSLFCCLAAFLLPPLTGRHNVGKMQYVWNHTTLNDPVSPNKTGNSLLLSFFYPTASEPKGVRPYLDHTTARVFENTWNYTAGTLSGITSQVQWKAPFLDKSTEQPQHPTLVFGLGGGGPPSLCYTALLSELASQGYVVAAIDHPYEQPYLQYADGGPGYFGLPVVFSFNMSFANDIYKMRLADTTAFLSFFPELVEELKAPFNTTHFATFGHSLGGASALGSMLHDPRIIGGINLDGLLFGDLAGNGSIADQKRPVMLLGNEMHTPGNEGTWGTFPRAQTGWWREILVNGAAHLDFSDATVWKGLGVSDTPEVSTIDGVRMVTILRAFVAAFFDFVVGKNEKILDGPSRTFPEANFVGGKNDQEI